MLFNATHKNIIVREMTDESTEHVAQRSQHAHHKEEKNNNVIQVITAMQANIEKLKE